LEQISSCETKIPSLSQEIPRILGSKKVRYLIHSSPSPDLILSQIKPVCTPIPLPEDPLRKAIYRRVN